VVQLVDNNKLYYIDLSSDSYKLGGSSFAQINDKIGKECPTIQNTCYFKSAFNAIQELVGKELLLSGHDISSGGILTTVLEMCFSQVSTGMELDFSDIEEDDIVKLLFAENSGVIIQSADPKTPILLKEHGITFYDIGQVVSGDSVLISKNGKKYEFNIVELRDEWYETSYLLDQKQSGSVKARERFDNYKKQPLQFEFPAHFTGKKPYLTSGVKPKAAIIREKGSNSEREMAYAMYLAGFDVKDVHMTDLISGRETLEDIQFIAAVGGFSNSDVLGSAKGWAGAFLYNEKARKALNDFFSREDTLSLGVCNGCQLFVELGLINPDHELKPKMLHNDTHKFECTFSTVKILENNAVMLHSLVGSELGIWSAHGEGKFNFPLDEDAYEIPAKYSYSGYPANPNGSDYNAAMLNSSDGRHLVMMPHLERSTFPWNWAAYPKNNRQDEVTPWLEAFVNARKWIESHKKES
jgi:phosphoribosylformylglycinamidine synthase